MSFWSTVLLARIPFAQRVTFGSLCLLSALATVANAQLLSETRPQLSTSFVRFQEDEPSSDEDQDVPTLEPQTVVGELEGGSAAADTTVTTPTTTPIAADEFGGVVRVLDSADIQRSNAPLVSELLRTVPGVDVVRSGPPGGLTSIFLRGGNSQFTKVLVDGVPVNDPSSASRAFDFSALSTDNIERIEVLPGPQSILYGSDAIGGVINIVTRRGEGPLEVRLRGEGGSFGTQREAVSFSGGTDKYYYSAAGSWFQTDSFSAASIRVGGVESDKFELGTIGSRVGWTPTENFEIDYSFRWSKAHAEIDDASFALGAPPTDDLFRANKSETFFNRVQVRAVTLDGLMEHVASFFLSDYDREDTDDLFPTTFTGQTRKFQFQTNLTVKDGNILSAGVDYLAEDATSLFITTPSEATQNEKALYVQDQFQIGDRVYGTAGYRWTDHIVAGTSQDYRFTGLFDIWETGTRVRGSIGTAFRAPSLAENLFPFGNPNLQPETSKGWEYGFDQDLCDGRVRCGATYFRNNYDNLILFDLNTFTLQNIGAARSHGVELTGGWDLNECLTVSASYTHTDTFDRDTGQELVRRPDDKGTLQITQRMCDDRASVTLYGIFVGDRIDARDASVVLDNYAVFNLAGDYSLSQWARVFFRIDNLFDEDYEEITGFTTPPFSGYAGLQLIY